LIQKVSTKFYIEQDPDPVFSKRRKWSKIIWTRNIVFFFFLLWGLVSYNKDLRGVIKTKPENVNIRQTNIVRENFILNET
jgi:hypothetical protein